MINHLQNNSLLILISPSAISTNFRSSPKVPYVDETVLEKESKELSEESKELLSIYHKSFDDERVSCPHLYVHVSVLSRGLCFSQ